MITSPLLRRFLDIDPEAVVYTHTEIRFQSGRKRVIKEPHIIVRDPDSGEIEITTAAHQYTIPLECNIEEIDTLLPKDG
jgi:hypothetical protein